MTEELYKKILVPFDNSKFSKKALQTATILAKAFGSTLCLVTIVDISIVMSPGKIHSRNTQKTLEQIKRVSLSSAESFLQKIESEYVSHSIKTQRFVIEGLTSEELLKFVKKHNVDLVIMGSQGLSGFSKLKALGSISRKISEFADCPVMIVH